MAEAAIKAAVDSYVGTLITITTKSGMRYEGCLHCVDPQECTIGLRNVKSFGTEERRGNFVVSPSDKIYEYIVFIGSDIKDLRAISSPPSQSSTPYVLDDPAIIESRDSLPPPMHIGLASTGAVKVPNLSTAAPSGHPIFSFLGSQSSNQLPSVHWGLSLSPTHVNVNKTALPSSSYLHGLIAPSELVSQTQSQKFPPVQHSGLNASFSGASTFTELNRPSNQPVCTQQFTTAIPGLSPAPGILAPNHACAALSAVIMDSVPQKISSVATAFDAGADLASATKRAASIIGPVPCTSMDTVSRKFPFTPDLLPGALESSSKYLQNAVADAKTIKFSASEPQPSGKVEEADQLLSKPAATTLQMLHALTMFKQDSAMNDKFKKDEVWGLVGKSYKCEDKKHVDGTCVADDEDGAWSQNLDCKHSYSQDVFYDHPGWTSNNARAD